VTISKVAHGHLSYETLRHSVVLVNFDFVNMAEGTNPIKRNGGTAVARNDNESQAPPSTALVSNLLSKLRPFQREAYEFATQGKISPRMRQSSDASLHYDPELMGTGRILLADEMGLG
jgi:hypothetical protein